MTTVHLVVPEGVDDPTRPSGGNAYDRRVRSGLAGRGWTVVQHEIAGSWPNPDRAARETLAGVLADVPDRSLVVLDGMVACGVPDVVLPAQRRLRLVVLVHLPLGHGVMSETGADAPRDALARGAERQVLAAAVRVVVTSRWTRAWLLETYGLPAARVAFVTPGVDAARLATPSSSGGRLLCVGAVTPVKGHDLLLDALREVHDLVWSCRCAGSTTVDPAFTDRVRSLCGAMELDERVRFTGPLSGDALELAYAASDLVLLPSRVETYGMVVTEALARGIPVLAAAVGGIPEALGRTPDARLPGILVTADDPSSLATALRRWLTDAALRQGLRDAARARRCTLPDWSDTTDRFAEVLTEVAA